MVIESGEFSPNTAGLTACRAGDIVFVGEKGGFKFLYTAAMPASQSPNLFALGPAARLLAQQPFSV